MTTPDPNACAAREKERAALARGAQRVLNVLSDPEHVRAMRLVDAVLDDFFPLVGLLARAVLDHCKAPQPPAAEADALHAAARASVAVSREPVSMADASRHLRIARELGEACHSFVQAETRGGLS